MCTGLQQRVKYNNYTNYNTLLLRIIICNCIDSYIFFLYTYSISKLNYLSKLSTFDIVFS